MEALPSRAQLLQESLGNRRLQPVPVDRVWDHIVRAAHIRLPTAQAVAKRAPRRGGYTGETRVARLFHTTASVEPSLASDVSVVQFVDLR